MSAEQWEHTTIDLGNRYLKTGEFMECMGLAMGHATTYDVTEDEMSAGDATILVCEVKHPETNTLGTVSFVLPNDAVHELRDLCELEMLRIKGESVDHIDLRESPTEPSGD